MCQVMTMDPRGADSDRGRHWSRKQQGPRTLCPISAASCIKLPFSDKIHFLKSNSIKKGKRQKLFFLPRLTTDLGRSFWPWGRTRPGVAPTACPAWRWRRGWRAACWPTGPAPRSAGHGASSTGWSSRSPRTAFCRDPIAGQDGGELRSRGMSSEFLFVWGASVEDRTVLF